MCGLSWCKQPKAWLAVKEPICVPFMTEASGRMGKKKAIMVVAHRLAIIIYHMMKKHEPYREDGPEIVEERLQEMRKRRAVQQLKHLGYEVSLQSAQSA